nr:MAG TPA: hypothetical protein [Caudoviricetes sp.]
MQPTLISSIGQFQFRLAYLFTFNLIVRCSELLERLYLFTLYALQY